MNQVWNIFRKDARHHRLEIAASLALLAAFAWFEIRSWRQPSGFAVATEISLFVASFLPGLVNFLLPLSWVFLIVRVIHGEGLVGDRQFWITRPYDWKQLIAAKTLFVLVFINLPLFSMDVFLLARSGFHPTHFIIGLVWMQMMWTFFLFLPVAATAAVTSGIPQMLLAVPLLVLYFIGMSALSAVIPNAGFPAGSDWTGLLVLGTSLAIILIQYARRKTVLSRWLIAGLGGVVALILIGTPYKTLIARQYPLSRGDLPVQLSLMSPEKPDGHYPSRPGGKIAVLFPLKVSGLSKDFILELDGMVPTLDNSRGLHWNPGWRSQRQDVFPDAATLLVSLEIEPDIFDQLRSAPVDMHLVMAFSLYHEQNQRQFVVPGNEFNLDGVGLCSSRMQYSNSISCRAALRRPSFLLVTSKTAASTCPLNEGQTPPPPGRLARGFVRGGDSAAEMGISPIRQFEIFISDLDPSNTRFTSPGICPGTPLALSNPEVNIRRRVELEFDNLSVNEYAQTSADASRATSR